MSDGAARDVQVLLCKRVLDRIPEVEDETIGFLQNWLSKRGTKAVVLLQDWKAFVDYWEGQLRLHPEVRDSFFAMLRGIITPYRDKYAVEAGLKPDGETLASMDEVEAMKVITQRHYATCEYLVTEDPELFRAKGLRLPDSRILKPEVLQAEVLAGSN